MNLTRRALFGLVAGLPFALKAGAVTDPKATWRRERTGGPSDALLVTYMGVPVGYAEELWHMSHASDPTDWDSAPWLQPNRIYR